MCVKSVPTSGIHTDATNNTKTAHTVSCPLRLDIMHELRIKFTNGFVYPRSYITVEKLGLLKPMNYTTGNTIVCLKQHHYLSRPNIYRIPSEDPNFHVHIQLKQSSIPCRNNQRQCTFIMKKQVSLI